MPDRVIRLRPTRRERVILSAHMPHPPGSRRKRPLHKGAFGCTGHLVGLPCPPGSFSSTGPLGIQAGSFGRTGLCILVCVCHASGPFAQDPFGCTGALSDPLAWRAWRDQGGGRPAQLRAGSVPPLNFLAPRWSEDLVQGLGSRHDRRGGLGRWRRPREFPGAYRMSVLNATIALVSGLGSASVRSGATCTCAVHATAWTRSRWQRVKRGAQRSQT